MAMALVVAGCASGAQTPTRDGASPAQSSPRILRVGINQNEEPSAEQGGIGLYNNEVGYMVHTSLTVFDGTTGTLDARIAERVPTVENGDWLVLPDGRMEVTWKLRPNALWHDGTPLTAEDVVFGFRIAMDPELFSRGTGVLRSIDDVVASDPHTVTMRWKEIYIYATDMGRNVLVPLPRHLIGAAYDAGNKQTLSASPFWTTEFVGAGPFSMGQWLQGSFMELNAFDNYFLGKPKIDRISVRYFGDVNALIVSTIAGEVDVIPVGSLKTEEAHTLATQWEAAGAGTVIQSHTRLRVGDWQFRDPSAPWVPDPRVRQALVKLIDRQGMVETIHNGLSATWDIPLSRQDPAFQAAQQRGLPNLSYDPTQAHRLLAEAGLTRGPDGAYRTQSGAPFTIDLLAQSDINTNVQELLAISGQWKTGGVDAPTNFVPGSIDWREAAAKVQGVYIGGQNPSYQSFRSYISPEVSTQANRWRGANRAGYTDPAYDQLYNRLFTSVDVSQRTNVAADLVKMSLDGMLFLPLTYSSDVAAARKEVRGVTGVVPDQRVTPWNVHEWEIVR
jgi:peptide/nickel transport system substrate-binding protein